MQRPDQNEYAPYYHQYIKDVPQIDILEYLNQQLDEAVKLFSGVSEEKASFRYATDKWSVKEVLGHIMDSERIFAYRALCISRGEKNSLPGFEQNDYVANANFDKLKLADIVEEFVALRKSNLKMFGNFSDEMWTRKGIANKNEVTVRAIAYVLAGHALHHLNVVRERYLNA
ncbi:MAG: DinB family protein [Bacteroidetes bacterium]|nr:DinB family protein [Bacteroidota bacterium]